MKKTYSFLLLFTLFLNFSAWAKDEPEIQTQEVDNSIVIDRITNNDLEVTMPSFAFSSSDVEITIKFKNPNHTKLLLNNNKIAFIINGEEQVLTFADGIANFKHRFDDSKSIRIYTEDFSFSQTITVYPMWVFFVPIGLILIFVIRKLIKK